jgi:hypothetical protein
MAISTAPLSSSFTATDDDVEGDEEKEEEEALEKVEMVGVRSSLVCWRQWIMKLMASSGLCRHS